METLKDIVRAAPTVALIVAAIVATFYLTNDRGIAADPIEVADGSAAME